MTEIAETYVTDAAMPRRRGYALFMRWTRRVHMYAGLFMLPWVLVYGTSALFFNHADFMPLHEVRELRLGASAGALAGLPAPAEYAQRVVEALEQQELVGDGGGIQLVEPGAARYVGTVHVTVETEASRHELFVDVADGDALLRTYDRSGGEEEAPPLRQLGSLDIDDPLKPWLETSAMDWLESEGLWAEKAIHRGGPRVEFNVMSGGEPWRVTYDVGNRSFQALPLERRLGSMSARSFLTSLHTSHGFPTETRTRSFWALAVDLMGSGMIIWALSGILMWWQMPKVRMWGGVTLALSLMAAVGLGYAMYSVFTN